MPDFPKKPGENPNEPETYTFEWYSMLLAWPRFPFAMGLHLATNQYIKHIQHQQTDYRFTKSERYLQRRLVN